ncbi:MAG: hypothetical protein ABSF68_01405 [Candidatus Acidiferrales bacterium]|jgi:hypothetical protein
MKKKVARMLVFAGGMILVASMLSLTGCYYLRPTGPCFGVGCPARTVGQNGQYKKGEGPRTQTANAQAKSPQTGQTPPEAGK